MSETSRSITVLSPELDKIAASDIERTQISVPVIDGIVHISDDLSPDCETTELYVVRNRLFMTFGRSDGQPLLPKSRREVLVGDESATLQPDIFKRKTFHGQEVNEIPFFKRNKEEVNGRLIGRWAVSVAYSKALVEDFLNNIGPAVLKAQAHQQALGQ